jgi:putative endonuclease
MEIGNFQNVPGIYILQSHKNGRYYIGSTSNLTERIIYHNSGKVKATKNQTPWEIKYFHPCLNITIARQIEYKLKKLKRRDYIEGIIRDQKIKGG